MEQHISTTLEKIREILKIPPVSRQELFSINSHIELTDEEIIDAIIAAQQKKAEALAEKEREAIERKNREALNLNGIWTTKITDSFMRQRMGSLGFVLDSNNSLIYETLCQYFSDDPEFVAAPREVVHNIPSLTKGILLFGNFGCGKTMLMKLFSRNKKKCFRIVDAKYISEEYENHGEGAIKEFLKDTENTFNDRDSLYQKFKGLCIDDFGAEEEKKNYGNKKNVIRDIIEKRYSLHEFGYNLHGSTNMSLSEIESFYGKRFYSRIWEMFNLIQLPGEDRRRS